MASGETVMVTVSREGWVDLAYVPDGVRVEVYDFGSETKTEELVQQELEAALKRVRDRAGEAG